MGKFSLLQRKEFYNNLSSICCATEYRLTIMTSYLTVALQTYSGTMPISLRIYSGVTKVYHPLDRINEFIKYVVRRLHRYFPLQ